MAAIINEMPIKKHLVKIALSIMLIVALIATTFLTTDLLSTKGADRDPMDVSNYVDITDLTITSLDNSTVYMENGVKTSEYMMNGSSYNFSISWEVLESIMEQGLVKENDWFYISLSDTTRFSDTSLDNSLVAEGITGEWGITDNKIYCKLTDIADDSYYIKGSFTAQGTLNTTLRDTATITIDGTDYDINVNPSNLPELTKPTGAAVNKYGVSNSSSNELVWHILVNQLWASTYYVNKFNNPTAAVEPALDVRIIDELPATNTDSEGNESANDIIFKTVPGSSNAKITINVPINYPTYNSEAGEYHLSSVNAANFDITSLFTDISSSIVVGTNVGYDDTFANAFNSYVMSKSYTGEPVYAFSPDNKTVAIYAGDLPDTLVYANSEAEFRNNVLPIIAVELSDAEKDALVNIYGESRADSSELYFPARSLDITVTCSAEDGTYAFESYTNEANLYAETGTGIIADDQASVDVSTMSGTIVTVIKKTVKLLKTDSVTNQPIEGAQFKLRKYTATGTYTDDAGDKYNYVKDTSGNDIIATTGSDGYATIKDLSAGTYEFEEISNVIVDNSTYYNKDTFTTTDGDQRFVISESTTDSITKTATNELQTSVSVRKIWDDSNNANNLRPTSITVKLLANGVDTKKELTLSEATRWHGTFNDLPVYQAGSTTAIVYTIEEVNTDPNYTASVNGYEITNTLNTHSVSLTKKDVDTDENISGASFRLYRIDTPTEELIDTKTTSDGVVIFNNLVAGTYKIEETSAASNYLIDSVVYSSNDIALTVNGKSATFEITNAMADTIYINATNKKQEEETTTVTEETSTSADSATTAYETTTATEETSTSADSATTAYETTSTPKTSVQTGDSISYTVIVLLLASASIVIFSYKRKDNKLE